MGEGTEPPDEYEVEAHDVVDVRGFPLDFVEVVWGDGQKTERQIISTTDLPPFGKKRFQIPLNAAGKKWVRFAAWDVATNGAFVQPVRLTPPTTTTAAR